MAENQRGWQLLRGDFVPLLAGYSLFLLGCYFWIANFFPAVNIFSVPGDLLLFFAIIFVMLGILFNSMVRTLALLKKHQQLFTAIGYTLLPIVERLEISQNDEEKIGKGKRAKADLEALRRELREELKESEVRLRGEWQFTVQIILVVLGILVTIFLALKN
jgi:hypothetical protein